jgi:hypothetical protein
MQAVHLREVHYAGPRRYVMANCDFFSLRDGSARESHTGSERVSGERDYIQHVRSHILSAGERLIVFLFIALLTGVAVGGRLSPGAQPSHPLPVAEQPVTGQPVGDWHYHVRCEEESPYSGRSC